MPVPQESSFFMERAPEPVLDNGATPGGLKRRVPDVSCNAVLSSKTRFLSTRASIFSF